MRNNKKRDNEAYLTCGVNLRSCAWSGLQPSSWARSVLLPRPFETAAILSESVKQLPNADSMRSSRLLKCSITSALEQVYEFYIDVQAAAHKVGTETYEATWHQVSKQSERQLGAFLFVRALCAKSAPLVLRNADVEFRNAVIHKGKIPSRKEALDYGQRVLDQILQVLKELRSAVPVEVDAAVRRHITKQREAVSLQNVAFMSIGTLVSMNRRDTQPTLMQWIDMLERQRLGRIDAAARATPLQPGH